VIGRRDWARIGRSAANVKTMGSRIAYQRKRERCIGAAIDEGVD
jgi:hypothetical protein